MVELVVRAALAVSLGALAAVLLLAWRRRDAETLTVTALLGFAAAYVSAFVGWHLWWLGLAVAAVGGILALAAIVGGRRL